MQRDGGGLADGRWLDAARQQREQGNEQREFHGAIVSCLPHRRECAGLLGRAC